MNPVVLQVLQFIWANRQAIIDTIKGIEDSVGQALPGNVKAQAVKDFIAKALGIESQIEQAWPIVQPLFNLVVAAVKAPKA